MVAGKLQAQDEVLDSLKRSLRIYTHDTARALSYLSVGEVIFLSDPDSAFSTWSLAKNISETNLKKALSARERKVFKKHFAIALLNLGYVLQDKGRIPEALSNFFQALKLIEEAGEKEGFANVNLSIGSIYAILHDTAKALSHYRMSLKEYLVVGEKSGIAAAYNNIGTIYNDVMDLKTALPYYKKAVAIEEEIDDKAGLGFAYNSAGSVYLQMDSIDKAMEYFRKAKRVQLETNNVQGLCYTYNNIGTALYKLKKYKEAEESYLTALKISKANEFPESVEITARELAGLYEHQQDYMKALEMEVLYINMRDTVNSQAARRASIQEEIQYEYDKKAAADSIRHAEKIASENLKHDEEIKQQKIYASGGVIGFLLMLVIAITSLRAFRNKQKANLTITEQKKLAEQQKHMIEEKQKEIIDSITYARRIQRSLLPTTKYIDKNLERLQRSES
jgi:tetratricopeptide (TPR) repeat protein